VFSGTEDRLHTEDMIRDYTLIPPYADYIRVRNCGHLVHEEKADRFNEAALSFLTKKYVWEEEEPI